MARVLILLQLNPVSLELKRKWSNIIFNKHYFIL